MSLMSKVRSLLPKRASLAERADRKRAGAEARRQIQIDKANPHGVANMQNVQNRGNVSF